MRKDLIKATKDEDERMKNKNQILPDCFDSNHLTKFESHLDEVPQKDLDDLEERKSYTKE